MGFLYNSWANTMEDVRCGQRRRRRSRRVGGPRPTTCCCGLKLKRCSFPGDGLVWMSIYIERKKRDTLKTEVHVMENWWFAANEDLAWSWFYAYSQNFMRRLPLPSPPGIHIESATSATHHSFDQSSKSKDNQPSGE
ncbi:hypothetical protein SORBI_3006G031800 [Sorghum bicolor]|uniref:Uncharacterized protein n=1 Tax=Sorghum bicolor TaxID=4558 RepID=A0A1Z5RBW2_SORBI|nr:hypothetical protein SORBI_3006G031800 [Sorghum bicolor]